MESSCKSKQIAKADHTSFRKGEYITICLFSAAALVLRILCIFRYPIDSDEPQHLHVVWGWTRGLLQYRDVFDNHTPLFHMLAAPVLALVGERPEALFAMRFAMLPLFAVSLWCTYAIGREIHSKRVGLWAAFFTALFPAFFFGSLEFRTDNLWTAFFLLAFLVCVKGRATPARAFLTGVLLGAAFSVSQKTVLLVGSLSFAFTASVLVSRATFGKPVSIPFLSKLAISAATGFLLLPGLIVGFYAFHGALREMIYGIYGHNVAPCGEQNAISPWWSALFLVLWVPIRIVARRIARSSQENRLTSRRMFLFLTLAVYLAVLQCFWPFLTLQNYLPACPLLMLFLVPFAFRARAARKGPETTPQPGTAPRSRLPLFISLAAAEMVLLILVGSPWHSAARGDAALLKSVLRLTDSQDYVLDLKGETLFRNRSFFYAMEAVTIERMECGTIVDDIRDRLVETRTCVAVPDDELFPPVARKLLLENYVSVGNLRVAGRFLTSRESVAPRRISFDVLIAARYDIVSEKGDVSGLLDGVPYKGSVFLNQGAHDFESFTDGALSLVWSQAVERGFTPFTAGGSDGGPNAP